MIANDTISRMQIEALKKRLATLEKRMAEFEEAGVILCKSGANLEARVEGLERDLAGLRPIVRAN